MSDETKKQDSTKGDVFEMTARTPQEFEEFTRRTQELLGGRKVARARVILPGENPDEVPWVESSEKK